ncbi:hypothetical protein OH492_19380 [Vibrio chagasii]|nr:hypothetical protein [Vibrio chagasii]
MTRSRSKRRQLRNAWRPAEFWEKGFLDFGKGKPWTRHASFREDPEINALGTPSGFIEITSRTVGNMGYEHCQEHPMWFGEI